MRFLGSRASHPPASWLLLARWHGRPDSLFVKKLFKNLKRLKFLESLKFALFRREEKEIKLEAAPAEKKFAAKWPPGDVAVIVVIVFVVVVVVIVVTVVVVKTSF